MKPCQSRKISRTMSVQCRLRFSGRGAGWPRRLSAVTAASSARAMRSNRAGTKRRAFAPCPSAIQGMPLASSASFHQADRWGGGVTSGILPRAGSPSGPVIRPSTTRQNGGTAPERRAARIRLRGLRRAGRRAERTRREEGRRRTNMTKRGEYKKRRSIRPALKIPLVGTGARRDYSPCLA